MKKEGFSFRKKHGCRIHFKNALNERFPSIIYNKKVRRELENMVNYGKFTFVSPCKSNNRKMIDVELQGVTVPMIWDFKHGSPVTAYYEHRIQVKEKV